MPESETERISQRIFPGAKFTVLHWFNTRNSSDREFTINDATPGGTDYHGAFKIGVSATQDSTGQKWVGFLAIMPESGTLFADLATLDAPKRDYFRLEAILVA